MSKVYNQNQKMFNQNNIALKSPLSQLLIMSWCTCRRCHIEEEIRNSMIQGQGSRILERARGSIALEIFENTPTFALTTPIFDQRPRYSK